MKKIEILTLCLMGVLVEDIWDSFDLVISIQVFRYLVHLQIFWKYDFYIAAYSKLILFQPNCLHPLPVTVNTKVISSNFEI